MLIFKRVIFALISALTLYIGNVLMLPPKRGGSSDPPPPLPTPLKVVHKGDWEELKCPN